MCSCCPVCYCDMLTHPCIPLLCLSIWISVSPFIKNNIFFVIYFSTWLKMSWYWLTIILFNMLLFFYHFSPYTPNLGSPLSTYHCSFISIFFISICSPSCFLLPQFILEEMASREQELCRLKERAHCLWEGQAAGKGFVHRVSQLSAQYLALSNLTKVKLLPCCNLLPPSSSPLVCASVWDLLQHAEMSCSIHVLFEVKAKEYSVLFLLFPTVLC